MDKKLFRNGPYADFFSQGVQMGNILTLAGQLGDDLEGNVPNDLQGQMENCYKNIETILKEFNATLDNIIDETWFVTDIDECMTNVSEIFDSREKIYNYLSFFRKYESIGSSLPAFTIAALIPLF